MFRSNIKTGAMMLHTRAPVVHAVGSSIRCCPCYYASVTLQLRAGLGWAEELVHTEGCWPQIFSVNKVVLRGAVGFKSPGCRKFKTRNVRFETTFKEKKISHRASNPARSPLPVSSISSSKQQQTATMEVPQATPIFSGSSSSSGSVRHNQA